VSIETLGHSGYARALDELAGLRPDMAHWREGRARWFDLGEGVCRYDAIYEELSASRSHGRD
jgi:hypothetical protein